MISSIKISNFKSYDTAGMTLSPVTFLVGLNGSGKTNLIELLKFVSLEAKGLQVDSLGQLLAPGIGSVRALKVDDLVRRGKDSFFFELRIRNGESFTLSQTVEMTRREGVAHFSVADEELKNKEGAFVYQVARAPQAAYFLFSSIEKLPPEFNRHNTKGSSQYVRDALSRMVFLEPDWSKLSHYVPIPRGKVLEGDGSNLSAVAYRLCNDPKLKDQFFSMVKTLPEREFKDVKFSRAELLDEVMLACEEEDGKLVPLQLLSQGTLRVFLVAAALLSIPSGSMLVLEELDTGIHPSRVEYLIRRVYEIAAARDIQVLATTHNPQVLNVVPENEVPNVVLCHRDVQTGCSRLTRLGDMPEYVELMMQDRLGGLIVSEALEKVLRNPQTPEQRKSLGHKYIQDLGLSGEGGVTEDCQ